MSGMPSRFSKSRGDSFRSVYRRHSRSTRPSRSIYRKFYERLPVIAIKAVGRLPSPIRSAIRFHPEWNGWVPPAPLNNQDYGMDDGYSDAHAEPDHRLTAVLDPSRPISSVSNDSSVANPNISQVNVVDGLITPATIFDNMNLRLINGSPIYSVASSVASSRAATPVPPSSKPISLLKEEVSSEKPLPPVPHGDSLGQDDEQVSHYSPESQSAAPSSPRTEPLVLPNSLTVSPGPQIAELPGFPTDQLSIPVTIPSPEILMKTEDFSLGEITSPTSTVAGASPGTISVIASDRYECDDTPTPNPIPTDIVRSPVHENPTSTIPFPAFDPHFERPHFERRVSAFDNPTETEPFPVFDRGAWVAPDTPPPIICLPLPAEGEMLAFESQHWDEELNGPFHRCDAKVELRPPTPSSDHPSEYTEEIGIKEPWDSDLESFPEFDIGSGHRIDCRREWSPEWCARIDATYLGVFAALVERSPEEIEGSEVVQRGLRQCREAMIDVLAEFEFEAPVGEEGLREMEAGLVPRPLSFKLKE